MKCIYILFLNVMDTGIENIKQNNHMKQNKILERESGKIEFLEQIVPKNLQKLSR